MYLPAKFGDRRCQRNGDINSYINSSGVLFRNVDLQLQSPGYKLAEKREEEEYRQLQSVMHFTQTQ